MRGPSVGVTHMLVASFFFSLMSLLVKAAGETVPTPMIVLARALVTLVLSWFLLRRMGVSPWGTNKRLLLLRGALGFVALTLFYESLTRLPLADATVIQYTNPVLTALLAAVFLKERITRGQVVALLTAIVGVLLIARPSFLPGLASTAPPDPLSIGIALAAAVFSSMAYIVVRMLRRSDDPLVIVFYFPMVVVPLSLPLVAPVLRMPTLWEWALLLGVGITTQIAQVRMTRGLHLESAGKAASVTYIQIVFAMLWGVLFFSEPPSGPSLVGAALVIGATLFGAVVDRPTPPDASVARGRNRTGRC